MERAVKDAMVKKWLSTWALPASSALLFCIGAYYRFEHKVAQLEADVRANRFELDKRSSYGPGGFLDPGVAAGMDAHIHAATQDYERKSEAKRWRDAFFDLNPQLKRPTE